MENKKNNSLIGASGCFYVMSKLAYENIHASCTFGNAPVVDILASSVDGSKTISIQVKTAHIARRTSGRGINKKYTDLDWPLSDKAVMQNSPNLFFTLVDLWGENCKEDENGNIINWQPTVYVIPSKDLTKICLGMGWTSEWWRLKIGIDIMEQYKDRWDLIKDVLNQ